ncbi:MAG: hypothetical protein WC892_00620 [Patescibacteria group bacterium]
MQELRDKIGALKVKEWENSFIRKQLAAAQNRLAYLTASVYVVVDDGKEAALYGVSSEAKTRAQGLFMSLGEDDVVDIRCHLVMGSFTLCLPPGEQVNFTVTTDLAGEVPVVYCVGSFFNLDFAQEDAQTRQGRYPKQFTPANSMASLEYSEEEITELLDRTPETWVGGLFRAYNSGNFTMAQRITFEKALMRDEKLRERCQHLRDEKRGHDEASIKQTMEK